MSFEHAPPHGPVLTKTPKNGKIQNLKFHNSLNNFGRDPLYEYVRMFLEWICCVVSEQMSFEFFISYAHKFTKAKKNRKKIKQQNKAKQNKKKWSADTADRSHSPQTMQDSFLTIWAQY